MNVTRFEPWSVLNLLHRDMNDNNGRRCGRIDDDSDYRVAAWSPAVDIVEEKERFVLRADVPGVDPDAITLSTDKGVLSLAGERTRETSDDVDGVKRYERRSGKFRRQFTLPESADAEAISARSANGILEIVIPKLEQVQARRITVEAA